MLKNRIAGSLILILLVVGGLWFWGHLSEKYKGGELASPIEIAKGVSKEFASGGSGAEKAKEILRERSTPLFDKMSADERGALLVFCGFILFFALLAGDRLIFFALIGLMGFMGNLLLGGTFDVGLGGGIALAGFFISGAIYSVFSEKNKNNTKKGGR